MTDTMRRYIRLAPIIFLFACLNRSRPRDIGIASPAVARADSQGASPVLVLRNGPNPVDLLGDGTKSDVFVAWKGNYNGHGSSTVAFRVFAPSDRDQTSIWQVVPFYGGPDDGDSFRADFHTSEGADCILGDIRVVRQERGPVQVVVASRELGASFADPAAVRFDYYALTKNVDGTPGWSPFYFKFLRSVAAKRAYCDVNEAFASELGLGSTGFGRADGGR
jgi:hypothetical protein